MLRVPRWLTAGATAAGLVLAAACSDSNGPGKLTNPAAVTADLASLDSAFSTAAFESFSAISPMIGSTAAGLSTAALVIEVTRPAAPAPKQSAYLRTVERGRRLQQLVPTGAALVANGIFPDSLKGKTFEYDTASNSYVVTARTGADPNGVRFILCAIEQGTELPAEPLVEVGRLDLIDESTVSSVRLHIVVQGVGGTPTYIDYLATVTPGPSSLRASVAGSISNGLVAGNKTLGFTVVIVATTTSLSETASFSLNNPSVNVSFSIALIDTAPGFEIQVDFRVTRPGQTVQIAGTLTFTEFAPDSTELTDIDAAVRVNGATFATYQGPPGSGTWTKADGTQLTADEGDALDSLGEALGQFLDFAGDLFDPLNNLFGS